VVETGAAVAFEPFELVHESGLVGAEVAGGGFDGGKAMAALGKPPAAANTWVVSLEPEISSAGSAPLSGRGTSPDQALRNEGASRPRARARSTASARRCVPSLA
jgi:hypothetical protein